MPGGKLPQPQGRAIEVEIVRGPKGARRLTIRIGMSVFVLFMLVAARALGFDVQALLRLAMQYLR